MVELLLDGRFTGKPEGVINVDVNIKKINNRNIMSVIEDMLNVVSTLCLLCKAMSYLGSCNKSIKSTEVNSMLCTTFCTLVTK